MKYLWVDSGNDPDTVKAKKHSINGFYFDMFDPRLNSSYLSSYVSQGYSVGVYMASNWSQFDSLTPGKTALKVFDQVKKIAGNLLTNSFPKVQFDMEEKDPVKILSTLRSWRAIRPYHDTCWTMESGQGGWMGPVVDILNPISEFVISITALRVRLAPQLYNGDMTEVRDSLEYSRNLTKRGFPDSLISPFYDAAHLPAGWSGWAFTQGRLP